MNEVTQLRERIAQLLNDVEFLRVELNWQIDKKTKRFDEIDAQKQATEKATHKAYYMGVQDGIKIGLGAARSALSFIDECYPVKRATPALKLIRGGQESEDENAPRQRGEQ